jgi:ABC-2 type transport system permease protein
MGSKSDEYIIDVAKPSNFSFSRSRLITHRVLRQISRDRRTFGMMIAMPIIVMIIFGFALSGEIKNLPVVIDNQDEGYTYSAGPITRTLNFGQNATERMQNDDRLQVTLGNFENSKKEVDTGKYFAVILIPANFSYVMFLKTQGMNVSTSIDVYIDATKPAIRGSILGAIQTQLQNLAGGAAIQLNEENAFGGAEYSGLDVSIPSVMGFVLMFLILLLSLLFIMREKIGGTQERLFATPLKSTEWLVGYATALVFFGLIMASVILIIGVFVFGAAVKGNIILLYLTMALFTLTNVLLAVFLSNFAKNELQAVQMAPILSLPAMALSGVLTPVNSLPVYVRPISKIIPLTYGNQIFEGIMLKGWGISELWPQITIISIFAVVFFVLALITVQNRINA